MPDRSDTAVTLWPCDARAQPLAVVPASPWTRYLAWVDGQVVGGGGFTGPPRRGRVEIGYFTLSGQQGLGHGRQTASALVALARAVDPALTVIARTRRVQAPGGQASAPSASARILQSLGFGPPRAGRDARSSPVWCWSLPPARPGRVGCHPLPAGHCGPSTGRLETPGQRPAAPTIGA